MTFSNQEDKTLSRPFEHMGQIEWGKLRLVWRMLGLFCCNIFYLCDFRVVLPEVRVRSPGRLSMLFGGSGQVPRS